MATLTEPQIAYIRAKTGDNCTPPVVDDGTLQIYFDAADSDLSVTIVSVLEDLLAAEKADVSRLSDLGTSVDTSRQRHLWDLLNYWRDKAGIDNVDDVITVGVISLGTDYVDDGDEG